jgi:F-box-like
MVLSIAPSVQYRLIDQLPTELLLFIFHYNNSGVKDRLRFTHVCKRWREIAIASGSLWTNIDITPPSTASNEQFANFISLLDLQFVCTQNLPLDVVWHICGNNYRTTTVITHIKQNGPFHRWKSLTLSAIFKCPCHPLDGFPNLESLIILPFHTVDVILTINRTTTSKLRSLDISQSCTYDINVDYFYGAMLHHISRLVLGSIDPESQIVTLPLFPANIVEIHQEVVLARG